MYSKNVCTSSGYHTMWCEAHWQHNFGVLCTPLHGVTEILVCYAHHIQLCGTIYKSSLLLETYRIAQNSGGEKLAN